MVFYVTISILSQQSTMGYHQLLHIDHMGHIDSWKWCLIWYIHTCQLLFLGMMLDLSIADSLLPPHFLWVAERTLSALN